MKLSSKVCLLLSAYGAICILAFESAEARVMLPSTQLKGRDKLVEIVTKINENSKAAEAAHNIDVHDILDIILSEMDVDTLINVLSGMQNDLQNQEQNQVQFASENAEEVAAAAPVAAQQEGQEPVEKRASEAELMRILGDIRTRYQMKQLNGRVLQAFLSQYSGK